MLFDAFLSRLAECNRSTNECLFTKVSIDSSDYLSACEAMSVSEVAARKNNRVFLDMLFDASIEWKEKGRKRQKDFCRQRLCTSVSIKEGLISVSFCQNFVELLLNRIAIYNNLLE
jgi:hypothetical protein